MSPDAQPDPPPRSTVEAGAAREDPFEIIAIEMATLLRDAAQTADRVLTSAESEAAAIRADAKADFAAAAIALDQARREVDVLLAEAELRHAEAARSAARIEAEAERVQRAAARTREEAVDTLRQAEQLLDQAHTRAALIAETARAEIHRRHETRDREVAEILEQALKVLRADLPEARPEERPAPRPVQSDLDHLVIDLTDSAMAPRPRPAPTPPAPRPTPSTPMTPARAPSVPASHVAPRERPTTSPEPTSRESASPESGSSDAAGPESGPVADDDLDGLAEAVRAAVANAILEWDDAHPPERPALPQGFTSADAG